MAAFDFRVSKPPNQTSGGIKIFARMTLGAVAKMANRRI
jgi:hypothetical protein